MSVIAVLDRSLPRDIFAIARALRRCEGMVVLASAPCGDRETRDVTSFVLVDPVAESSALVPDVLPEVSAAAFGYAGEHAGPRWIGALPYEAFRSLERAAWSTPDSRPTPLFEKPRWQKYDACVRVSHVTGEIAVEADDERAALALLKKIRDGAQAESSKSLADQSEERAFEFRAIENTADTARDHRARVERALQFIAAGDIYQVNLARRFLYRLRGDRLEAFRCMMQHSPVPHGFFGQFGDHAIMSASPELALEVSGRNLRTCPIKGTRPRGTDAREDDALAIALDTDEKERAELTMAIDLHRNDFGKIAVPGSVRVPLAPRVIRGRPVMSRVAEIFAERRADASLEDCVRACLPSGSVTGAPKIRAMEIIASLEPARRGLYTGALGYVGRDGRLVLAMAIRTAVVNEAADSATRNRLENVEYFSGGGIVAASDPTREEEETRWKAAHLDLLAAK